MKFERHYWLSSVGGAIALPQEQPLIAAIASLMRTLQTTTESDVHKFPISTLPETTKKKQRSLSFSPHDVILLYAITRVNLCQVGYVTLALS